MKTRILSLLALVCCPFLPSMTCASEPLTIALSEIQFLPASPAEPARIELCNRSRSGVDISGWFLLDRSGHKYVFPDMPPVPPDAFVVVSFGIEDTIEEDDNSFDDNVAYLYCKEAWAEDAFRGKENECALFSSIKPGKNTRIEDFVRWGRRPHIESLEPTGAEIQAVAAKLWSRGYALSVADPAPGDRAPVKPGGSIARKWFEKKEARWLNMEPRDASLGRTNPWPTPCPVFPVKDGISLSGELDLRWEGERGEQDRFQVQVARDIGFADIMLDKDLASAHCLVAIEPGRYYWRVRVRSPQGVGKWSDTAEFILRKEKNDRDTAPKQRRPAK